MLYSIYKHMNWSTRVSVSFFFFNQTILYKITKGELILTQKNRVLCITQLLICRGRSTLSGSTLVEWLHRLNVFWRAKACVPLCLLFPCAFYIEYVCVYIMATYMLYVVDAGVRHPNVIGEHGNLTISQMG